MFSGCILMPQSRTGVEEDASHQSAISDKPTCCSNPLNTESKPQSLITCLISPAGPDGIQAVIGSWRSGLYRSPATKCCTISTSDFISQNPAVSLVPTEPFTMWSRNINHRKPKRPNINPIHEEPGSSEERFSDDSKDRVLNSPLQLLVEYTQSEQNVSWARTHSNPISRTHSLDYCVPGQNPSAALRRNTFTEDQSCLPVQGGEAVAQAAKPSMLDWQNRRFDLEYRESQKGRPLDDRAGQLQSYTPQIGRTLSSNPNEVQRRLTKPAYTMNGRPQNDAPISFADQYTQDSEGRSQFHDTENANFSTADATKIHRAAAFASVDYETELADSMNGLEGLRIDARRDQYPDARKNHYPVQSNIPNYYQEPSPSGSMASRTNSTASSDSRRSEDAFGLARLASNPYADYLHNRLSMDSVDRSPNSFRSEKVSDKTVPWMFSY